MILLSGYFSKQGSWHQTAAVISTAQTGRKCNVQDVNVLCSDNIFKKDFPLPQDLPVRSLEENHCASWHRIFFRKGMFPGVSLVFNRIWKRHHAEMMFVDITCRKIRRGVCCYNKVFHKAVHKASLFCDYLIPLYKILWRKKRKIMQILKYL